MVADRGAQLLVAPQLADFLCEALTQVGTIQKHADLLLPITVQMQIDCFVDSAALLGGGMKS